MISLQNILSGLSLIVSSGAVGYAVRLVIKIEVLEHLFNEKKEEMDDILDKQIVNESDILRLKDSMARIDFALEKVIKVCETLPQINERLGFLVERIGKFSPKEQIDGQIERLRDKVVENSDKINRLDAKLTLHGRPPIIDVL